MRLWVDWSIVDAVGACVQVDDGDGVCHECCLLFSAAGMFQVVLQCRATVPLRHWTHVLTIMLHWHQCSRLTGTLVCCCWLSTNDAACDCSGSVSAVCCEYFFVQRFYSSWQRSSYFCWVICWWIISAIHTHVVCQLVTLPVTLSDLWKSFHPLQLLQGQYLHKYSIIAQASQTQAYATWGLLVRIAVRTYKT